MSSTIEKLAVIDDSTFETLVILYLRQKEPSLSGLIQTGVNQKGESIKCKVDGILYDADSNQCVSVASTVTELAGMKRKWLGGKKGRDYEKGDIAKADEEFAEWRTKKPKPKLILHLAVNSHLENKTDLYKDAVKKGKDLGIKIKIIEGSQLVHFLDYDSEGQYIRQELLGIKAGRLSESLLKKVATDSLTNGLKCRRHQDLRRGRIRTMSNI